MPQKIRTAFLLWLLCFAATPAQSGELTRAEKAFLDRIDAKRAYEQIRHVSEEVVSNRNGAGAGSVIAGTEDEKKAAKYIADFFSRLGLEVERQSFPVRVFEYEEPELRVADERFPAVSLYTAPGTYGLRDGEAYRRGNMDDGEVLELTLVDVGLGIRADYERVGDVTGKAVLIQRDDDRTDWPSLPLAEAAHRGAAAAIFYGCTSDTPAPGALKQDSVQYQDAIPALSVTRDDAGKIQQKLAGDPVTITIRSRVTERDGDSLNVIGRLAGTTLPDQSVIYGAHMDRWFHGAQDNSTGIGSMLELARVFAKDEAPERTLIFIAFGGEEAGGKNTLADWLTGSYAFTGTRAEQVHNTALYFNLDSVGWGSRQGTLSSTPEAMPFFRELVSDLDLSDRLSVQAGLSTWMDSWCFGGIHGTTSVSVQWRLAYSGAGDDELNYLDFYHTDMDRFDEKRISNIPLDLKIAALAGYRMSRSKALPYDFSATASWLEEGLQADAKRVPSINFGPVIEAVTKMKEAASSRGGELDESIRLSLRKRIYPELVYAGGFAGGLRTSSHTAQLARIVEAQTALQQGQVAPARAALEAMLGASRHLSPEPYKDSRRRHVEMTSWNAERGQLPPLPPEQVYDAYELLDGNPDLAKQKLYKAWIVAKQKLQSTLRHVQLVAEEVTAAIEK